jgi:RimJ/RimL family protein N-acetyltransferase
MQPMTLQTERLDLLLEGTDAVLARIEALPPEHREQVSPAWLEQLKSSEPSPWTHGFGVIERASGVTVGSCAYRGAPDPAGCVEIAYEIHPEYRGHGFAREAASALVRFAYSAGATRVCAHTLQTESPSTSVLTSCGFCRVGDVVDPEDGPVWRWEHAGGPPNNSSKPTPLRGAA